MFSFSKLQLDSANEKSAHDDADVT